MDTKKLILKLFFSFAPQSLEGLKRQGCRETDIMVVAKNRSDTLRLSAETDVMIEVGTPAVSSLAGVMMDSFLTMMTGGMTPVKQASDLTSKLVRMGVQSSTAKQCEMDVNKGKILVMIDKEETQTIPSYDTIREIQYESEEQLDVRKKRVQIGEVQLRKEIVEELRTIQVPVIRQEVYVERRPVIDGQYDGGPLTENEIIRIPITEERIEVTKRPVVVEEVVVGKRKFQETKEMKDTVRKEEARIEQSELSDSEVYQRRTNYVDQSYAEVAAAPASDIPKEEKVTLSTNKKQASQLKVTTSPVVEELQEAAVSVNNQKQETQAKGTNSPASEGKNNTGASTNKNMKKK
ncbi:YsnF/AvaK domain-containing protein [Priestia megaterium]|uniref:YsnF/AvaK domain-containing protein n=1 Tax=Priestia megaterium TaxID=1404 RepID=UPI003F7FE4E8